MKIHEIIAHVGATLVNTSSQLEALGNTEITGVASLRSAQASEVSFLTNMKYYHELEGTRACALIVAKEIKDCAIPQILHANPMLAVAKIAQLFCSDTHTQAGISPLAFVAVEAKVAPTATIYPFAYVGEHAEIADEVVVYSGVHIGREAKIGAATVLYPNVVIMDRCEVGQKCILHSGTVIGGDGFGFVPTKDELVKIPQMGKVIIEDHVEIGSLCSIDRATFDATVVKRGAKLDSHVHLGHNVEIGELSMLCAQVGIAGSSKLGKRCIAAGQVGISNGIELGDNMVFGGKAGVIRSESKPGEYHGMPAVPAGQWIRQSVALEKLPDLLKRVQTIEKKLEADGR